MDRLRCVAFQTRMRGTASRGWELGPDEVTGGQACILESPMSLAARLEMSRAVRRLGWSGTYEQPDRQPC